MSPRVQGVILAVLALAADQGNKLWLIEIYGIEARQPVRLAPFFDVIAARNTGISYSLFSAQGPMGRWILVTVTALFVALIGFYLWTRVKARMAACGFGLILGGAAGNIIDRFRFGWVADFYYFHLGWFHWYVFNLADVAIVFGVVLLLIDGFRSAPGSKQQTPGY